MFGFSCGVYHWQSKRLYVYRRETYILGCGNVRLTSFTHTDTCAQLNRVDVHGYMCFPYIYYSELRRDISLSKIRT